ncbi:hypothetical protein POM88_006282 [Heracleum sosnowskyi]|uniref:Uncharacterized protein n=1 Tax=Heracleum sosnowskyi TaxID=360622 RepID=A0AAD8J410_9APIA|nr:hypothetical protein POM88_006282 [Heracleum sosnowskyi]
MLNGKNPIANVEVKLLGDSASTCVQGYLVARNSRLRLATRANRLFWKTSDNKIQVKDGVIPFSNTRVGVPLDSEFEVIIIMKCDDVKYTSKLTLIPQEAGTIQRNMCEDRFQVTVTWGV